jgi:Na+-driven multidrug efflux pump
VSLSTTAIAPASTPPLRARAIARFLLPLALNGWLVTLAGPVLNAALGRAAEPRLHLAAFWLAFTVLLVIQSACLVLQQVTAASLRRREPLAAVAVGAALLGLGSALLVLAVAVTPLGDVVFRVLIPTPAATATLARAVLAPMAIIPLLIAVRGLAGGVALTGRRTELLAIATIVRVLMLAAAGAVVVGLHVGASAVAVAWALVLGTASETMFLAAAVAIFRDPAPAAVAARRPARPFALAPVFRLALPLAVATLVWTCGRPLVGAILGRLADPELALAGFGVVLPVLLVTCAPLWAFLDVALVLPQVRGDLRTLVRFALLASVAFSLAIAAVTLTPLRGPVLRLAFALPPELERVALPALALLALEPVILSTRAIAQALLIRAGRGGLLLALSPVKLACMLAAGLLVARLDPHVNGAALALALFIGGDAVDAALYTAAVHWTTTGRADRRDLGAPVTDAIAPDLHQEAA